ncbi:hypothetical protein EYR36_003377 [Pleurotus pulmonarius]|nr:hypothetical protein EYR36_003377 [Pleurotus pulmonarius]
MFRNLRLLPPGILAFLCTFIELTNAQSPPIVVCAPGQCLQGYSNITIGATVSSSQTTVQLLPGQYTSTTNPQLLHDILTSRTSSLSSSPGFGNATSINLPLELALDPGIAVFPQPLYAGQSAFAPLPISANSSLSTSLSTTHSIALSSNTWIALDNRVVLWDSVPDMRELPFGNNISTLSLVAIQSSPPPAIVNSANSAAIDALTAPACAYRASLASRKTLTTAPSAHQFQHRRPAAPSVPKAASRTAPPAPPARHRARAARAGLLVTVPSARRIRSRSMVAACARALTACVNWTTFVLFSVPCEVFCLPDPQLRRDINRKQAPVHSVHTGFIPIERTVRRRVSRWDGCLVARQFHLYSYVPSFPFFLVSYANESFHIACDSSCTSCAGDPKFCLTCANNQLATSDGKCVQSCPSNTFSSSSSTTCTVCHPDCASCSGGAFNQCTACPPERPVLANGRCLPTCAKSQFLDPTSSTCQSCDSTCSSCSAAGPSSCLACSDNTQVLRAGRCVAANCSGSSTVLPGLGVCLSELVSVPQPSGTGTAPPLPTVTGLDTPTVVTNSGKRGLEWWQILLMALGCAFIFLVFVWLFRRRARKARAKRTAAFAFAQGAVPPSTGAGWWWRLKRAIVWGRSASPSTARRNVLVRNSPPHPATAPSGGRSGGGGDWKWWLVRWGEKLFGHRKSQRVFHNTQPQPQRIYKISEPFGMMHDAESMRLQRLRAAEEARRGEEDYDMLLGQYDYPRPGDGGDGGAVGDSVAKMAKKGGDNWNRSRDSLMSAPSIYSQMTGMPRKGPDPRIPVKR